VDLPHNFPGDKRQLIGWQSQWTVPVDSRSLERSKHTEFHKFTGHY